MAYFTSLWKARIIEKYKREYENEKLNSILASNTELPRKTTSVMQKWRIYRRDTRTRIAGKLKKFFPEGSSVSNVYYYLKKDRTLPDFVLKGVVGFVGGVALTYLCFVFFVFQLSISLIHATVMSAVIGVLLTLGLAFSYRIRCLVFLLIPQLFSRVGRYTLTCYALVLILTGPATNTFKNSEVLSESMACSQEQIKTSVRQINESMKKPFNAMKDTIQLMVATIKQLTSSLDEIVSRISVLVVSIADVIQSSLSWLNSVGGVCNRRFGMPYDYCMKAVNRGVMNCKKTFRGNMSWLCSASSAAKSACWTVRPYKSVCFIADYATTSFAATMKRKLRVFTDRINKTFFIHIETQHIYTFSSNASDSATQVAAGIVTELRNRADPLLTWLSWSSCVTSLFLLLIIFRYSTTLVKNNYKLVGAKISSAVNGTELRNRADPLLTWLSWSSCVTSVFLLLIIFRAKYYQHMFETRSRFDNRYVTQELRELDLKRYREGRETILPLNRREQAKYINVISFHLVATEKLYLARSVVFMTITTFKLLIHIVADYSLYWVLVTMRYHGRSQTVLPPGPLNAGVKISGHGIVADFIRSIFDALTIPLVQRVPSPSTCLPNPYPPDFQRYAQIAVLIMLLWFFSLFEPYGLRLRHVIMGRYRPERAKTRAVWLYNHILRTRGSFMKLARRKLHREFKYSDQENLTFRCWINSLLPCWYLRYILGTLPKEPHCLLCNTLEEGNDSNTKLISCKTAKCPGIYCARCYCDIGHLCTICLSPEDYGDMSDVSLEKGSSDNSSEQESEDDHHDDAVFTFENNNVRDHERERLIKTSSAGKKSTQREKSTKAPKEHKSQAEDEIVLMSSDDEPQDQMSDSRYKKYLTNYKTSFTNTVINKTNITLKEYYELNNWYFKVHHQVNNHKMMDLNLFEKYRKAHDNICKRKKSDTFKNCDTKFKKRCLYKLKRKTRSNKWQRILRAFSENLRYRHFNIFWCSKLWCECIYKFNIYHIKITARSFHVSKKYAHSRKINKFKRRNYKCSNYKNKCIRNPTSNIQKIFSTRCEYKKCKNQSAKNDQKNKNKRGNNDLNRLSDNVEFHESKKEADFIDTNVCKKYKNIAKNKHSFNAVQKFLCSACLKTNNTPSREIAEARKCCCLKDKTNFKRRKKTAKENKAEINNNHRTANEEKVNARNYRLSSYLSDQSWIWQKFCKDPEERLKMRVPSNNASTSKTKSSKHSCYSMGLDMDWLSMNIKTIKIKEIKLAIKESFLHLRIKNPLPMMKELYSTLLEASSKMKKGKNDDQKDVKLPPCIDPTCCQYLVKQTYEDRTTQIDKMHIINVPVIPKYDVRDAAVEVAAQTCTCATQYRTTKDKTCSCMKMEKNTKEFGDTAKSEDYSSNETESDVTLSTIYLTEEDTKTDTTVCSRVVIDYEVSPRRATPKKNYFTRVKVITKANQATSTDRAKLCDVSTTTSDWWSPIVERKFGRERLGRGEMYDSRRKRQKCYKDRSASTDGRIVTFMSKTQVIPTDTGDILSPSRYLLESQKYYNELFSSQIKCPRVYPVNVKRSKDCKKNLSLKDSTKKGRETPRLKISKSSIDHTVG